MPLRPLAITVVACLVLVGLAGPFWFHPDTLQDLLSATDCAELGACVGRGSVSRAGGLVNGAVFVRHDGNHLPDTRFDEPDRFFEICADLRRLVSEA